MKDKIIKNINLFFIYVSLFIIVKYVITTSHDIYYMLQHEQINNFLNDYVRILQNFIFFGSLLSLFISRFKAFSLIIPIAFLEVDHSFFNMVIAPYILKNNSGISPEYIRISIFLIILGVFLFRAIWKKRKITDIFLTLSMAGVLGTAILFHIITTKQLDYFTNQQEQRWHQTILYKNIESFCMVENIICQKITNDNDIKVEFVKSYYKDFKAYMNQYNEYFYYLISSDNHTQSRILARKPLAFVKYDGKEYYMLDNNDYTNYLKFNERIFGYLAISSHIVWIFGTLYLIYFHTKRRKKFNTHLVKFSQTTNENRENNSNIEKI